jgi:NAD(P)H-flavin reductase
MPVDDQWLPATVVERRDETPALHAIALELDDSFAAQHRTPGQVVKVRADGAGESYFALATAPSGRRVELLLKRGGAVADAVIAGQPPAVEVTAPFGRGFPVDAAAGRDVLLFAAGSGIAPIRALVQHLLVERARFGQVALFYGQRSEHDFAYQNEFAEWRRAGVRVVECASGASPLWSGGRGHVQDVARASGFGDLRVEHAVAFVCGMKPMVVGVRELLAESGVGSDRVHLNF